MNGAPPDNERVRVSPHFTLREFRCRCCGRVKLDARLPELLEAIRALWRRPMVITSGYRCPAHNASVGGAAASLHMRGRAADVYVPAAEQSIFLQCACVARCAEIVAGKKKNYVHIAC